MLANLGAASDEADVGTFVTRISNERDGVSALILSPRPFK